MPVGPVLAVAPALNIEPKGEGEETCTLKLRLELDAATQVSCKLKRWP
jgi:hypothetical protein